MAGFLRFSGRGVWRFLILPPKNPSPRHLNPCRRLQRHDPQQLAHSSYHRVPPSPGITPRPSPATRPISMPSYPVHDALSGSQVLMDVITLSGPHAEPGAGGSALAMAVLKPSVSIAAAAKTSERFASNMIDTSGGWTRQAVNE